MWIDSFPISLLLPLRSANIFTPCQCHNFKLMQLSARALAHAIFSAMSTFSHKRNNVQLIGCAASKDELLLVYRYSQNVMAKNFLLCGLPGDEETWKNLWISSSSTADVLCLAHIFLLVPQCWAMCQSTASTNLERS